MTNLSLVYWISKYSSKDATRLILTGIRCGFDTPLWRPGRIASTYQKTLFGNAPETSNSANVSRAIFISRDRAMTLGKSLILIV
jgi:hypothetical protein